MKKKDIFLIIGTLLFLITILIDRMFWNIPDWIETIIYIVCIILLLLGYLFNKTFMNSIKILKLKQKILYIILIIVNIVFLGFVNLLSNFWFMLLYLVGNYFLGWLIYKFVK